MLPSISMLGRREESGFEVRLRGRGVGRWLDGAFLSLWLVGWAFGEGFVLWILAVGGASLATGVAPAPGRLPLALGPALAMGAFLLLWLALWTVGGIAAIRHLLRSTLGEDRLTVTRDGLRIARHVGPMPIETAMVPTGLRTIFIDAKDALVAQTAEGAVELSALGSSAERRQAALELSQQLGIETDDPGH